MNALEAISLLDKLKSERGVGVVMDVRDYLAVSKLVNDCPNCGSSDVQEGNGSIGMLDPVIERTCKCGFKFEYDVNQGTKPKQIRQAINEALSECQ